MGLWINDSGASTGEIEAGVRAASAYFDRIGWRPRIVHNAMLDDENAQQERAQELWSEAESAAFKSAFVGWARWPEGAILVWNEEEG